MLQLSIPLVHVKPCPSNLFSIWPSHGGGGTLQTIWSNYDCIKLHIYAHMFWKNAQTKISHITFWLLFCGFSSKCTYVSVMQVVGGQCWSKPYRQKYKTKWFLMHWFLFRKKIRSFRTPTSRFPELWNHLFGSPLFLLNIYLRSESL